MRWILDKKQLSGRLARWALILQGHTFQVIHIPGTKNIGPDVLSRIVHTETRTQADAQIDAFPDLAPLHVSSLIHPPHWQAQIFANTDSDLVEAIYHESAVSQSPDNVSHVQANALHTKPNCKVSGIADSINTEIEVTQPKQKCPHPTDFR